MQNGNTRPSAPDYTAACIVMLGVNLVWMLLAVWALWGLAAVALLGWLVNRGISHIAATRG